MKKICLLTIGWLLSTPLTAQENFVRCYTMEYDSMLRATQPIGSLDDFESWLQAKIAVYVNSDEYKSGSRAVVTIPVIFHIVHNGDPVGTNENIAATRVASAIDVLNNDFRKKFGTNGYNNHPAGADCEIEFCPAVVDPNGNILAEPGINRVYYAQSSWDVQTINSTLKPQTQWDPNRYLNVWSVVFGGSSSNLLGYAQFPTGSGLPGLGGSSAANTDGVVVRHTTVGLSGSSNAPYNLGRTLVHEIGHWLGLRHIWGDSQCGNDYCNDTPMAAQPNYGCPNVNSCNDGNPDPKDMVENYMDYSYDACMNIFTNCQKTRMWTVLTNSPRRASLLTSTVCSVPVTFSYTGRVVDAVTNQGIANAQVLFDGPADYTSVTDSNGYFTIPNLQQGNYNVYAGKWGYVTQYVSSQLYSPSSPQIVVPLQPGYYDDFLFDYGWSVSSTATTGAWVRDVPVATSYTSGGTTVPSNPGADVTGDFGSQAYITGNGGGQAGSDDVDGGNTILTSPAMNLSGLANPILFYHRWFFNAGGNSTPDDSLVISLINGNQEVVIEKISAGTNTNQWIGRVYNIKQFIPNPGANVYFRARTFDTSNGHLVEAGIDVFRIVDSSSAAAVPPTPNFTAGATEICAGQQVTFSDLSTNLPMQWQWTFPGGSPGTSNLQNPTVTYNTPGTYSVTLTVSNAAGSNTTTKTAYITVNPVVANFSQDKLSVCPGNTVIYQNESACNATSLYWIFQGGTPATSTDQAPEVLYTTPGYYDVTLIASNNYGSDTLVQQLAILVHAPPSLTTATTPDTNNTGVGTATVYVSGGMIPYSFMWSSTPPQTTPTAVNLPAGVYNVTVTDGNGCESITSANVQNVNIIGIHNMQYAGITLSPNPVKDYFQISVPEPMRVILYNQLGEALWKDAHLLPGYTHTYATADLPSGVYYLHLRGVSHQQIIKLLKL
ncbi:MAG: PKD domain-containing protein [Chitinophagales bacterium]|nr:PKD domain-containing protein [Chitinophagales bacterium]MDW8419527.1 PKD domain-containing protein [Chitinophagales bacterium]